MELTIMIIVNNIFLSFLLINYATCKEKRTVRELEQFRKQVEETNEDSTVQTQTDDAHSKLVSFLIKNVKEIFNDLYEATANSEFKAVNYISPESDMQFKDVTIQESELNTTKFITESSKSDEYYDVDSKLDGPPLEEEISTMKRKKNRKNVGHKLKILAKTFKSLTNLTAFPEPTIKTPELKSGTEKEVLLHLSKDMDFINKKAARRELLNNSVLLDSVIVFAEKERKRSCIFCNNAENNKCSYPENQLIPSIICNDEGDVCYVQNTPFGIVDRGCYSVYKNLSTYVCPCNLCNHISMSEMPIIFTKKKDWIKNIIELSHSRRLKKSVFKDMSCLSCEVKIDIKGDMLNDANCMEGNVGSVPTEICKENEICGIKAIKSMGYLWRGCVGKPLFNYWISFCDSDLCNSEGVESIYDT